MTSTNKRIEDIVFCLASADQLQAEAEKLLREADYFRWRAAEQISEELATGKSQRELAREIGRSQAFVSYVARVWQRFGDNPGTAQVISRPRFQDAYRHVQKGRRQELDQFVPGADADDDEREMKLAMLVFVSEPKKFFETMHAKLIDGFIDSFPKKCSNCGSNHQKEAAELAMRAITAFGQMAGAWDGEPDQNDLGLFWAMVIRPESLSSPCRRKKA